MLLSGYAKKGLWRTFRQGRPKDACIALTERMTGATFALPVGNVGVVDRASFRVLHRSHVTEALMRPLIVVYLYVVAMAPLLEVP